MGDFMFVYAQRKPRLLLPLSCSIKIITTLVANSCINNFEE